MTEVTNSEPVLMFNDKKYIISELHDDAKVIVALLQGLEQDLNQAKIQHDRLLFCKVHHKFLKQDDYIVVGLCLFKNI